jgi:hypothetical protein
MRNGKFIPNMKLNGKFYYKRFDKYEEAIEWRNSLVDYFMIQSIEFKTKEELDNYLKNDKNKL